MKPFIMISSLIFISISLFSWTFNNDKTISSTSFIESHKPTQPEELGKVNWHRDYQKALNLAKKEQKPILILFQEVPGCSTCRNYGNNVLSHPLIVEAIETLFVPVAIYNNKGGEDAKVLKAYNEPTWNNPVVRIVNDKEYELVPRLGNNYSAAGLVHNMLQALDFNNQIAPTYLKLLDEELVAVNKGTETATVAMSCYWSGEGKLGKIDGIVATQAGFMGGKEVVNIEYNPEALSYDDLIQKAQNNQCANHVYAENSQQKSSAEAVVSSSRVSSKKQFRLAHDPKYYLSRTHYQYVPMTPLQATRANSLVGNRRSPEQILSPQQIALADFIKNHPELNWKTAIEQDFLSAWDKAMKVKR
jgi:peptide methionine sulfoxide reductase MsrA